MSIPNAGGSVVAGPFFTKTTLLHFSLALCAVLCEFTKMALQKFAYDQIKKHCSSFIRDDISRAH